MAMRCDACPREKTAHYLAHYTTHHAEAIASTCAAMRALLIENDCEMELHTLLHRVKQDGIDTSDDAWRVGVYLALRDVGFHVASLHPILALALQRLCDGDIKAHWYTAYVYYVVCAEQCPETLRPLFASILNDDAQRQRVMDEQMASARALYFIPMYLSGGISDPLRMRLVTDETGVAMRMWVYDMPYSGCSSYDGTTPSTQ